MGTLLVRSVPRSTLRELSVLGARRDLSREAFARELLDVLVRKSSVDGDVAMFASEGAER